MNTKTYYAISVNKSKVLYLSQSSFNFIDVLEMNDISYASLFNVEEVKIAVKELSRESVGKFDYSKYYKPEELDIVKVKMEYYIDNEV